MLDFIQLANRKELRTVKSSDVKELCDSIWSLLAEIQGYFTKEEQDRKNPAFRHTFECTLKRANELSSLKCRSRATMLRKQDVLEQCNKPIDPYYADYRAIFSDLDYIAESLLTR